jgi:signal transduction histidine kinase
MAEIASYLAHEIRNPLNLISLTAHHIRNQFVPQKEELRNKFFELIESLNSEVEQLSKVVSHFMTMGRQSELQKINFTLSEIIDQVQVLVKQQLNSKNISMIISGEKSTLIRADIEQIRLVFLNLIVNAIAAVPIGGSIWFHIEPDSSGRAIKISISDNGTGIQEEDIEKIFDPYFTRKPGGTGLGLALVKRIIEEHDGTILAENRKEGGAHFEIILPKEGTSCQ